MYIATVNFDKVGTKGWSIESYWEILTGFFATAEEAKEKGDERIAYYKKEYGDEMTEGWVDVTPLSDFNYYLVYLVTGNINDVKPEMEVFGIFDNATAMIEEINLTIKRSEYENNFPLTKESFLITTQILNTRIYGYKNFD